MDVIVGQIYADNPFRASAAEVSSMFDRSLTEVLNSSKGLNWTLSLPVKSFSGSSMELRNSGVPARSLNVATETPITSPFAFNTMVPRCSLEILVADALGGAFLRPPLLCH